MSFVGTGDYVPARYRLGELTTEHEHTYFATAIAELLQRRGTPIQCAFLLATDAARARHGERLCEAFRAQFHPAIEARIVAIPEGRSQEEIWRLVGILASHVPRGASVVLDVTHGFRSQPIVAMAAFPLLYRCLSLRADSRILYGAFHALGEPSDVKSRRERGQPIEPAPVFDLTELFDLARWADAFASFALTGDGRPLVHRLRETRNAARDEHTRYLQPKIASHLETPLYAFVDALDTVRSDLVPTAAKRLYDALGEGFAGLERNHPATVIADLLQAQLRTALGTLVDPPREPPERPEDFEAPTHAYLAAQLATARWLLTHHRLLEAVIVTRELLTSLAIALVRPFAPDRFGSSSRSHGNRLTLAEWRSELEWTVEQALRDALGRPPRSDGLERTADAEKPPEAGSLDTSPPPQGLVQWLRDHASFSNAMAQIGTASRDRRNNLMHAWTGCESERLGASASGERTVRDCERWLARISELLESLPRSDA
ncbi:MAG: TM1812 family CRISPR-associated protein [Myxococcota bacterium]|nr:TM1812 family CRISPR-associated protein [Myxococcota bacterium]MDW8361647.1 TM1812 family CRISPR-associated protein [Myxococcales bacterium]